MILRRALLLTLVLAACQQVTDYTPQKPMTQNSQSGTTNLTVHFVKDVDDILKVCQLAGGTYYGCAKQGLGTCDVYFQQPKDFNDVPRLAVMGHELEHCMGARHD